MHVALDAHSLLFFFFFCRCSFRLVACISSPQGSQIRQLDRTGRSGWFSLCPVKDEVIVIIVISSLESTRVVPQSEWVRRPGPGTARMSEVPEEFTDSADEWEAPVQACPAEDVRPHQAQQLLEKLDGEERELAGEVVPVEFCLPDGRRVRREHLMGQTVAYLKAQLEDIDGVPYEGTTLFLGDRPLLDPLSLNDLPFKGGECNYVTVRLPE
ncbi:uncharacterized protein Tco025E_02576 [Trypanosoma conorhini]|uniref:Ubiquitin-like domain-containing protein n=1 Tax=Trypanosoma conorhini TaxID=83891 RepID=A0A422Q2V8_9TRYP|nr:uncharacterized protein Tco025E_02576 [Trypanosoma conorhini]RNF24287.1 hypothetical protein Tco025E_02576 [Trypanosoma conorhini]